MKSSKKAYSKTLKKYQTGDKTGENNQQSNNAVYSYMPAPLVSNFDSFYDVDLNTPGVQQGPMTQEQMNRQMVVPQELTDRSNKPLNPDYNSMFTLGLAGISTGLNYNADLQNKQDLYRSIQNRQSQPLYDYNYMYGRTTSGGTEYQPIVKAEMGARINKRYNTPNPINNVEIEGGEFLQLPDMSTEMAYGPSHSNGGIQTSLPEGTKVFSNHLKPMGSKKTFAQMAKKYDNTEYDKIIDNKFAKQVDRDTAMLMREKNQKILDKLFMDQQLLNGNSNGETMAKNGASINNAGFKALPAAVQQKILSNMQYGGYSLPKLQNGDWYNEAQWDAAMQAENQPSGENWYTADQWDQAMQTQNQQPNGIFPSWYGQGFLNNGANQSGQITNPFAQANQPVQPNTSNTNSENWYTADQWDNAMRSNVSSPTVSSKNNKSVSGNKTKQPFVPTDLYVGSKAIPTYTEDQIEAIRKIDPNFNPVLGTVPGMQKTVDGVYGSTKNIDLFNENYSWFLPKFKEKYGRDLNPRSKEDMGIAQNAFQDEMTQRYINAGYTPENAKTKASEIGFSNQKGLPNSFDSKLGFYTATRKPFDVAPISQTEPENKPDFGRELPTKETKADPTGSEYNSNIKTPGIGQYTKMPFPLDQAIPGVLGLAGSQEIFPYAIPEIDAPYVSPQTLNIQSQLQDIDNMGQASVRAGADPLSAYIVGIGGKEKAFQTKQNADMQSRSEADTLNAQSRQQADYINSQMFDRVYNNMIGQARDAQTAEQQAALTSIANNVAKHRQQEEMKRFLHPIYSPTYNYDPATGQISIVPNQPGFTTNDMTTRLSDLYAKQQAEAAKNKKTTGSKKSTKK